MDQARFDTLARTLAAQPAASWAATTTVHAASTRCSMPAGPETVIVNDDGDAFVTDVPGIAWPLMPCLATVTYRVG